jgi:hypothetical protein
MTIQLSSEEAKLVVDAFDCIIADAERWGEYGGSFDEIDKYIALKQRFEELKEH